MLIRKVEDTDIPEISRWFESIQWDLPATEKGLSRDGFVAVRDDDGALMACAWLYITGSSTSFVQWTNTNPDVTDKEQSQGLTEILKFFQERAPNIQPPIRSIVVYTKNEKFKEKLKQLNFRANFGYFQCTWVAKPNESKTSQL